MPHPTHRTPSEIAHLKENWTDDPCWDVEDTPGFEAHRDELKTWRLEQQAQRDALNAQSWQTYQIRSRQAREMGLDLATDAALFETIRKLVARIETLETQYAALQEEMYGRKQAEEQAFNVALYSVK